MSTIKRFQNIQERCVNEFLTGGTLSDDGKYELQEEYLSIKAEYDLKKKTPIHTDVEKYIQNEYDDVFINSNYVYHGITAVEIKKLNVLYLEEAIDTILGIDDCNIPCSACAKSYDVFKMNKEECIDVIYSLVQMLNNEKERDEYMIRNLKEHFESYY